MGEIFCYKIAMPLTVKACITNDQDGVYTIYVNSLLNFEQQLEGYLHELKHIDSNHFYLDWQIESINEIESILHGV